MAKKNNGAVDFGERLMEDFNITDPRQGVGGGGFMIGRGINGEPGIQMMGHFVPFSDPKWKSTHYDNSDKKDDGGNGNNSGIKDIDYPVKSKKRQSIADVYRPTVQKTFKEGGMVRGCGCAQRGRSRGKMV